MFNYAEIGREIDYIIFRTQRESFGELIFGYFLEATVSLHIPAAIWAARDLGCYLHSNEKFDLDIHVYNIYSSGYDTIQF